MNMIQSKKNDVFEKLICRYNNNANVYTSRNNKWFVFMLFIVMLFIYNYCNMVNFRHFNCISLFVHLLILPVKQWYITELIKSFVWEISVCCYLVNARNNVMRQEDVEILSIYLECCYQNTGKQIWLFNIYIVPRFAVLFDLSNI